jgi:WD40 repeat protein
MVWKLIWEGTFNLSEIWLIHCTLQGHSHIVSSVAWSPDGLKVVPGSGDYTIRIWDVVYIYLMNNNSFWKEKVFE